MKKLIVHLTLCITILNFINAQTPPNAFNYSAVARNAIGQPITSKTIGIQIAILKSSPAGVSQYSENHFVKTDAFGLFNLVIGAGAVLSGSMASIDWSNDKYFLKVGMDAEGGTNYLTMGTTQLLSVPYALYAKNAGSVIGAGFKHYIGEEFGGGVIFHLWKDTQGVEHGLIVDKTDLEVNGFGHVWSNVEIQIGESAQSVWDGLSNSKAIIGQDGHTSSAAALCFSSKNGGYSDWYLPSIHEIILLWNNYYTVARSLVNISGGSQMKWYYWSSTEYNHVNAYSFSFLNGSIIFSDSKINSPGITENTKVRAIRSF